MQSVAEPQGVVSAVSSVVQGCCGFTAVIARIHAAARALGVVASHPLTLKKY